MSMIPNIVTLSRLALLIPIIWLLSAGGATAGRAALGLLILAGLTDTLDGWLARRLKACSPIGVFLDPLVDKVLANVLLVFMALRFPDRVSPWLVLALLVRELVVQGVRSMAPCKGVVIKTRLLSKSKFLLQILCLVAILIGVGFPSLQVGFNMLAVASLWAAVVSGYVSMLRILWTTRDLWIRDDIPLEMR